MTRLDGCDAKTRTVYSYTNLRDRIRRFHDALARMAASPVSAAGTGFGHTTTERTGCNTWYIAVTTYTDGQRRMATHLATLEGVKGVKHPLILSPRVDAKRHNPTTIMRKTNQACAQPPTKARHNAPRTCGSRDTHRKGVCGSPRPIHASDTRRPHARATARRAPREGPRRRRLLRRPAPSAAC